MPIIGVGGPVRPRKKNCDFVQTGAIFRQEGSGSMSVNSTVVQNVLWSFRKFFFYMVFTLSPPQGICKIIMVLL